MSDDPVTARRLRQALPLFVALAVITGVLALAVLLSLGREILVPITLAILLSFVLVPAVRALRHLRMPRAAAVMLVVLLAFGALGAIGSLLVGEATQLAADLPRYSLTMRDKLKLLQSATSGGGGLSRLIEMASDLGRELNPEPPKDSAVAPAGAPMRVEVIESRSSLLTTLGAYAGPVLHPLATAGLILIFTIFILLQREDLRNRAIRLAGSGDLQRTTAAIDDATTRLTRFFVAQLGLNAAFGLVIGLGLWWIGVPSPLLFGVLAGILRFVPYIGAVISAVLPLILAAAVDPGWSMVVATALLFLIVEPIAGHVVEPLLYGHSTGLSPVAVILSATIWTFLWGPVGLVLATPLTVCLVVLGRHVERLHFLDVILGDEPALAPQEIFYQRMLAGDPGEAIEQGLQFLKARALVTYYDEVVLAALRLAQEDFARGTLDRSRQEAVGEAFRTVVERLGRARMSFWRRALGREAAAAVAAVGPDSRSAGVVLTREALAPRWQGARPVLCVSSGGTFDLATTQMLSQVLDRHGLATRVTTLKDLRDARPDAEAREIVLVCFSYLQPISLSQIRFVVRQTRKLLPDVTVLVGFWGERDPATLARLRRSTSADLLVTSLSDALEAALDLARTAPAGPPLRDRRRVPGAAETVQA
ncbi:AI-2E family transporter [Methylobacterium sp. ID0610]|uniref:AI-2E family transporter n=1 Tax=Methylobacterium carpenticola TaxID=3344827 RepID=UPI003674BEA2